MIVMLDTNQDIAECETELGAPCEELLTPLTRRKPQRPEHRFAIDNGAFSNFDAPGFLALLERQYARRNLCRFVAVPDVVGSAIRTLEVFSVWSQKLAGWNLALVAQDGQESLPIPWFRIQAIFIGGTTEFKMGRAAAQIIKAGKALEKWVHVGRVNTPGRFEYFEELGVDSIDGTGLARYSEMRQKVHNRINAPSLFPNETSDREKS